MKLVTEENLKVFLKSLYNEFDVRVPIKLLDGTRTIGKLDAGPLSIGGGVILKKITEVFFPQMDRVFSADGTKTEMQKPMEKPMFVVGFTAQDLDCLEFIDRFYSRNYHDDIYFNKRENSVIVGISGRCGTNSEFLKIAGDKCDLELICDGQDYIVVSYTETGKKMLQKIQNGKEVQATVLNELQKESDALSSEDFELIKKASKLLLEEKVPDEFWTSISDRCIACTSCNLSCPTCTCFDVFDRQIASDTRRYRMWDSCQLDGFMREVSGHNPMGRENMRTRRRIHHKLAADVIRWGHPTCFCCGRCDMVCPTGIGIKSVCREMIDKYSYA